MQRPRIVHAWLSAKQEFAAMADERAELKAENETLKRQFDWMLHELQDVTEQFRALRLAVLARQKAEHEVAALHRQREIARAQTIERDPSSPLQ